MDVNKMLENEDAWDLKWKELFISYQKDLRHAYYLNALLDKNFSILEIAAGSFRDMAFLNSLGYDCHGCDFSNESIISAKEYFPKLRDKIFKSNAFNLDKMGKKFDVTYHNGFWVCFEDDNVLISLYGIQRNITKKYMIITVHNGHNLAFKKYFNEKRKNDNLYAIRFFEIDEFIKIFGLSKNEIQIFPVGKGKLSHEDVLVSDNNASRMDMMKFMKPNDLTLLDISERLIFLIPI